MNWVFVDGGTFTVAVFGYGKQGLAVLQHFHANDTSMGGPGTGDVDYPAVVAALREVDYRGYVSVEVFDMAAGGPRIARDSLAFLRRVFGQESAPPAGGG